MILVDDMVDTCYTLNNAVTHLVRSRHLGVRRKKGRPKKTLQFPDMAANLGPFFRLLRTSDGKVGVLDVFRRRLWTGVGPFLLQTFSPNIEFFFTPFLLKLLF